MELQPPVREQHLGPLADLFAHTFSDYWVWRDYGATGYFDRSPYDWNASRIGIRDGAVVTHFGVFDFTMRIGSAAVRTAGIGCVATSRDQRGHGLMHETATACLEGLRPAGYDMSLLFGIPDFYQRYGYVSSFAESSFVLTTRDLPPSSPGVSFQSFTGDVAQFAGQYNGENAGVTGTFVRPTFRSLPRRRNWKCHVFDGGYVVTGFRNGVLEVVDCGGPPELVLDVARRRALEEVSPEIHFVFLPRRSPMGEYLMAMDHTFTMRAYRDGGPMVRVINLPSVLQKIAPELERRLGDSPLSGYSGALALHGDGESATVRFDGGRIHVAGPAGKGDEAGPGRQVTGAVSAGPALARLIIGDDQPRRVCRQSGITLTGDAVHLVPVLFPDQEPSTVLWDRF